MPEGINISMVTITSRARDYLKSVSNGDYVTLGVKGGGCHMNLPDVAWSDPIEDVLVLDPVAEMYVIGSEIDYVTELGGSFLTVRNPTAASSCGCGESFGI